MHEYTHPKPNTVTYNSQFPPESKTVTYPLPSVFNDMFFLGFSDQLTRWTPLANTKKPTSFPPYNLIKEDDDNFVIELAVAGYTRDDIDITVEKDVLTVQNTTEAVKSKDTFIHQGIAEREWKQKFVLGEYMEVGSASLKEGLLIIRVERHIPEELKPKTIKIK